MEELTLTETCQCFRRQIFAMMEFKWLPQIQLTGTTPTETVTQNNITKLKCFWFVWPEITPPLPQKKKRNYDLQHVSTGLFHSSAWFYSVLVHFCSATVKRMPAEQQTLQLAFLPLPARSFHGPQFHRPPPACFCARSLRCSIRLELAHTQWLTPGPHPQRRLGSLAPGGQSCHPQSPFTTRDKRHERAPSPESPLLFPGVILPRSPSTPPPPIPRKKKQENKAAKGEERGGEGRGEKNSTTPKLTVWQHVWSRPFLAFSMGPGLITDLNWGL